MHNLFSFILINPRCSIFSCIYILELNALFDFTLPKVRHNIFPRNIFELSPFHHIVQVVSPVEFLYILFNSNKKCKDWKECIYFIVVTKWCMNYRNCTFFVIFITIVWYFNIQLFYDIWKLYIFCHFCSKINIVNCLFNFYTIEFW